MRWDEIAELNCSVAKTLSVIGDRWTMLVLRDAFSGIRRFEHFQNSLKLTRHVLADRLNLVDVLLRDERGTVEDGVMATQRFLSLPKRPDAIFAIDDEVAIGAMIRIKTEGLKIPDDIAIAGFDNDKISEFTDPALTTVDIQRSEIGKKAIELLLKQIKNLPESNTVVTELVQTKLIIRESSRRAANPALAANL